MSRRRPAVEAAAAQETPAAPPESAPAPTPAPTGVEWIAPDLRTLARPIADLVADPRNARMHDEKNLRAIMASLRAHGQRKPIVVRQGVVIAGNGTLMAARELGYEAIACTEYDGPEALARAYAIADNRAAELAEWDEVELARALEEADAAGLLDATSWEKDDADLVIAAAPSPDEVAAVEDVEWNADDAPSEDFVRFSFGSHSGQVGRDVYVAFTKRFEEARAQDQGALLDDVLRSILCLDGADEPDAGDEGVTS